MALAELAGEFAMKVTHILTCALVACGMAASAASVEEVLNFTVVGWYQGVPTRATNNGAVTEHDHIQLVRFTSTSLVNALAIDLGRTDLFNGQLIYRTALDGSITNVLIRQHGTANEVDVTTNFTFLTSPEFVIDQVVNTNALFTNSYTETGLRSVSFYSSSLSFTNNGCFSTGSLKRTRKLFGAGTNGYGNLLSYSGGAGTFTLNTNVFHTTNMMFAGTNTVSGPAQINFATFSPVISPNDPIAPPPPN